jgi:hypothetical protein
LSAVRELGAELEPAEFPRLPEANAELQRWLVTSGGCSCSRMQMAAREALVAALTAARLAAGMLLAQRTFGDAPRGQRALPAPERRDAAAFLAGGDDGADRWLFLTAPWRPAPAAATFAKLVRHGSRSARWRERFRASAGFVTGAASMAIVHLPMPRLLGWSIPGNDVRCVLLRANGEALVGGSFTTFAGRTALRVVRWNGTTWQPTNDGTAGNIGAVATGLDGSVFVGGTFRRLGGVAVNGVARRQGTSWSPLGFDATFVQQIVARPDGQVLIAGNFPSPPGFHRLMRWQNGVALPIPLVAYLLPTAMTPAADGSTLVAILDSTPGLGLRTRVLRWDGAALVPTALAVDGQLQQLVELPNGDLILAGLFVVAGNQETLLRWDGQQVQLIPGAPTEAGLTLALAANGDLLVGGGFQSQGWRVARWDGATWQLFGTPLSGGILAVDLLPNGDVVVGERVAAAGGGFSTLIKRWDGTQWVLLGTVRGNAKVAWSPAGELLAFGDLVAVDNIPGALLGRLSTTCAAGLVDRGGGCSGSAGAVQQRVDQRAWLGGTLRLSTLGVPANALPLGVLGLAPTAVPLIALNPLGGAGCVLRVTPDAVALLPTVGGEARGAWLLPNAPALLGLAIESQTVVVETGSGGAVTALTASNAIALSIGAF